MNSVKGSVNMNKEFKEILLGIKRSVDLLSQREKNSLYIATLIMVIIGILTNVPAVILGQLVDRLVSVDVIQFEVIIPFILALVTVILTREALTVVRKYLIENIATQTSKEQTVNVIRKLLIADIGGYLYRQQIGSLYGRVFRSIQGLISILKLTFMDFVPIFFTALAAICIAVLQKPLIGSVMILVVPLGLYIIIRQVSSQKGIRVSLMRKKEEVDGKVVEMLSGIEAIRVLNTVDFEVAKIEHITENQRKIEIKHHVYMALFDAAKSVNEGFFSIVVIVLAIFLASQGIISKGDILVYAILFSSIVNPIREIHRIIDQASESALQVNDLYTILHQPIDISFNENTPGPTYVATDNELAIDVNNLSFSYGSAGVLTRISLSINKGESIGIAGASGCGKTTFIRLLLKLIHGYTGSILLFGKELSGITREEIAKKIAYVPQKPFVFSGTIRENIIYGCDRELSELEIAEAARRACILNEIQESLGGFNGLVTESGNNLSGGQRQRLALARVMLQTPDLIIFDEATSALDNINEAVIQQNLEAKFSDKTVITIAHRLTTLKNADRIVVFDEGRIVQEGNFKSLSETKGLFQEFLLQGIASKDPTAANA